MKRTRKVLQTSIGDDFIGTKFGPNNCLEVVAWCGERIFHNKKYTVFCSICSEDPELFGMGLFLITKQKIQIGRVPCGCSKSVWGWSEDQYIVKILREIAARDFKYKFIGFAEPFNGRHTKLHLSCELGETKSVTINNFLRGQNCALKGKQSVGIKNRKDDEDCIKSFMETGAYSEGTLFTRSNRKNKDGWFIFWDVNCATCGESYEASIGNLTSGTRGCSCSQRTHNKAYIHLVKLDLEVIGIKFGITSMTNQRRLYQQNKKSLCELSQLGIWHFEEVSACRKAERLCKESYNNYLTKQLLPDGYTETAPFAAINHIISIYESHGGVRMNE